MGLLGMVAAGAAEEAGRAGEKIGLTKIESDIREEAAKRLAEHHSALQEGVEVRKEGRAPALAADTATAVGEANLKLAPRMREAKIADAVEMQKAVDLYNQDPKNVEAKAAADAAQKKFAATAEASLTADLMKDPQWLKNKAAIMNAEHPERAAAAAASAAAVAKSKYELQVETELHDARKDLAKAQAGTDVDAIKIARDKVTALEGTAGRAQQTADATVLASVTKEVGSIRTELRAETASLLKAKEDLAAAPEATASHRAAVAAAEARVKDLTAREKTQSALAQQLQSDYQRQYGARRAEGEAGAINTPKPAAPVAATPKPLKYNPATSKFE